MPRWFAFAFLLGLAPPLSAADFDSKAIDDVVEEAREAFHAPGAAVVVVLGDKVVYLKGFGVKKQGEKDKVTPDTVFPIASCSKAFTATLIAMLVDQEKLKWDDKVRDHLPEFRLRDELADREITIRDLLSHRTGMPRHDMLWVGRDVGASELIHAWMKAQPATSFRSTWEYSNVPFTTAGFLAGKLAKSDWAREVKSRIFEPLQMKSTSATAKAGQAAKDHATPHYYGYDKSIQAIAWDDIDQAGGAGCVNSSARDMGNWLRFHLANGRFNDKRLLSRKNLDETRSPQMIVKPEGPFATYFPKSVGHFSTYGLGWFVSDYRGYKCVSHGGSLTGFRSQVMMIPEKKIGVCVLSNIRPSYVPEAIAKTVLDVALGQKKEDWVKFHKSALVALDFRTAVNRKKRETARKLGTKPSHRLVRYAGTYEERAYGKAEVEVNDDDEKLHVKWGRLVFRLDHYHFDSFTAVLIEPKDEALSYDRTTFEVQFRLGSDGNVSGMKFLDQEFKKASTKANTKASTKASGQR